MALYPDYAPKKKKFRLFDVPPAEPDLQGGADAPAREEPPRYCLRCTDTEMRFFRSLKLQLEGCYGPGSLANLFENEDDPDSLSLLPMDMYVCPKCCRTELVWCLDVMPGGEALPEKEVRKYERTFARCTAQQLRQVLEGEAFDESAKQAARNLLCRNGEREE